MNDVHAALDALEGAQRESPHGVGTDLKAKEQVWEEDLARLSARVMAVLKPPVTLFGPSFARFCGVELSEKPKCVTMWGQFERSMPRAQGLVRRHPLKVGVGAVVVVCGCVLVWWPLAVGVGLVVLVLLAHLKVRQITWNTGEGIMRVMSEPTCHACGYDLGLLAPAIDPARLDGLNVGPCDCPECGQRWPFVAVYNEGSGNSLDSDRA